MSQQSSVPAEPDGARERGEPVSGASDDDDDEWPDDPWPDDEDSAVGAAAGWRTAAGNAPGAGPPWPPPLWPPMAGGAPGRRRPHLAALVAVALIAAGIGAGIVLAARGPSSSPASQATTQAPARPGGNGAFPGAGGAATQMLVGGEVTAVSSTSVTIGGPGRDVTAVVTGATRFTGKVTSISGIKIGDEVTAQLTEHGGVIAAVTIADPGQLSGGGLP